MQEEESTKRYWMKFYGRFFDKHEIKILLDEDRDYVFFYIAMLLESVAHNGSVRYNQKRPYTPEKLARLLNMPVEKVSMSIEALKDADLLEILEDGTIFLPKAPAMCGCVDNSAERTRRWRENKKKQCDATCDGDVTACDGDVASHKCHVTACDAKFRVKSIEIKDKNIQEHISVQGGVGEGTDAEEVYEPKQIDDTGFKYPRSVLIRKCNAVHMADVLRPNEIEPFVDYLLEKRLCEQEANQTCSVQYVKALAKTWKSEGWNDPARHKVTYDELQEVVLEVNKTRTTKIDLPTVNRFWDFIAPDFKHKNGDTVTKYTVGKMLKYWVDIESENARKKEEARIAKEKWEADSVNRVMAQEKAELDLSFWHLDVQAAEERLKKAKKAEDAEAVRQAEEELKKLYE